MMKKKKQSRSQSSTEKNSKKTLEPCSDSSSPSPRLLAIFRSKLASGKDLKHMFRGIRSKTAPGLSSQSRIVRCPKCRKLLQEPIDATIYKCSGCDSILQAKRWELESNDNSIPEALLSSQTRSVSTEVESAEGGSRTPMRSTHREYNSRASPSVERGYHSESVYKHEASDIRREWMRRADEFSVTGDSDAFASARSSAYNSRSNASEWTQHERRYEEPPRVPFYPASPSPSSAYDYGYSSPFRGSQASASEQSYYHHQPNQFKQYGREGWFQESSAASPIRFPGEASDGNYNHWSSQSQLHDSQYHNLYESSSSATPHHFLYSERGYQAATAPHRSTYSEHSKSETSSEKNSQRDKKKYARKRNPVVKRYVLPSAGGAPFATCSYCLELLQLPQVSLHGKHRRYQVRCGSCSGVLKFSFREKADTVLDSPIFTDETVTNHQDSASEGHGDIYPDDSHLSCSDNGPWDRIYKNNDAVILNRNMETSEDKGGKEDIRSISSKLLNLKLEALQPQWKPSLNHNLGKQQSAPSETIGEPSRIHLEQSEEAHSEKLTKIDDNNSERDGCDIEEFGYEKNEILKPEDMFGDGSGESSEVSVYKNERMSDSSIEAETVADRTVFHIVEPNEPICETRVLSEKTRDTEESNWEESNENEEYGGERKWEDIMGDKPGLLLEKSQQYIGDSICAISSTSGELYEDSEVKEDTKQISNSFLVNGNQSFIGTPDQSGKATVTISRIHEEQSKYEYENLSERQELDKTICDTARNELEDSRYETKEALEPDKVSEDGSVASLKKASETFKTSIEGETGEERSISHQMDSSNENVENSYERLVEPVCLDGSGYAGERTWAETVGYRAGLHLEEYESNYENYSNPFERTSEGSPTFHMHEYKLGITLEPEEDAQGRSASSSRGSFSDHESSEESAVFRESQAAKPDQTRNEYETSSERQELSNAVFDIVRSELQECRYETNETFEPGKMVGVGSVVSLEKSSETIISETEEERAVSHEMTPQNENEEMSYGRIETVSLERRGSASEKTWKETMGNIPGSQLEECQSNPHEWTSERAPTFRLHEYELGTMPEPKEDTNGGSTSSTTDFFNDSESSKKRAMVHEQAPWLVDESKTEELEVVVMVEDGPSLHLEKCGNESRKQEETFEWTALTPTFRLHESELRTMLEPDEDADQRSESSSTSSVDNHESSKLRAAFYEGEPQLMNDSRTEKLRVHEMTKDRLSLDLEKGESMKLEETFEWTSERAPTFRLHESELGTMLEPNKYADGRSESSSRSSFNDHVISKEIEMDHEEEPRLVIDSRTEAQTLHLEECENEPLKLDGAFEWTSGRALTFRRREYDELGKVLELEEDANGRSESKAVTHEDETWSVVSYETKALKAGLMAEDGENEPSLHLEKCENEKMVLDETLEPRDDMFRLSLDDTLEKERLKFHLEMSEDKQVNLRQTSKQGDTEESIPASGSMVSSEGREPPSKTAELDSEAEEEILGDHLEHFQKENEKSGLTSEPYVHFYSTTEPSEIVGLRHALYQTQTSPLRSPLSSPIRTPIGSPLHILMRSPIASPMHSHIVSPLRSPINSSGSLSDVLFFGKKA